MDDLRNYLLSFDPMDEPPLNQYKQARGALEEVYTPPSWAEPDHWLGDYISHMDDEDQQAFDGESGEGADDEG